MKVIKPKNLPTLPPIWNTMIVYLLLDNLQNKMAQTPWTVLATILCLLILSSWIYFFVQLFREEMVDIFESKTK